MQARHCIHWRPVVATGAAPPDIIRRLQDYALGYADRLAERRR
jgi:hypothetical protein